MLCECTTVRDIKECIITLMHTFNECNIFRTQHVVAIISITELKIVKLLIQILFDNTNELAVPVMAFNTHLETLMKFDILLIL